MSISVVVCAKNEENCIEDCLKRLKSQTLKPEIIVVDGHSTDRTVRLAKKYADKVVEDHGKGIADARNVGWKVASGGIVAYCDADSLPKKDWVEKIDAEMRGKICVSGPLSSHDGNSLMKIKFKFWADLFPRILSLFKYDMIWGANMAFDRSVLAKNPFRKRFLEDYEIGHRLRKIGNVKFSKNLALKVSSRRFVKGFHRTCIKYYLMTWIRFKLYNDYERDWY